MNDGIKKLAFLLRIDIILICWTCWTLII